jgi:hypothetical protein
VVYIRNLRNILLVGIFCILLAAAIWYWTELKIQFYLSGSKSQIERIGQIKYVNYDALLNFSGQLIWQKINDGDFIFTGNSLQTNQDSSTEIILEDGQQITIGTNSLVRFIKEDDSISLQLVEGKLEVKSEKNVLDLFNSNKNKKPLEFFVSTTKGRLKTKSANLRIEKKSKDSEEMKFEIISGRPELSGQAGHANDIVSTKVDLKIKNQDKAIVLPMVETPVSSPAETELPGVLPGLGAPDLEVESKTEQVKSVENVAKASTPPKKNRAPAQVRKKSFLKLPEKIPLAAPKIKRVDVKVIK